MASVTIHDLRKSYGATPVIHGVSIDIRDGEFVTLVGPSGCGKSTLLRIIAGLEDVGGGEVRIGGRVVNDVAPKDRDIAMVFQSYALYPHMTVAGNMGFALTLKGTPKRAVTERVARAAEVLGLTPVLDRLPRHLSGGQRQRVAMGRAIVRDPQVFLFDEPLSNLDAKLRVQMRTEIKELHQRLKSTMIYVTHDQIEAMTMADRIVVMRDGIVEQVGEPLELYDRPANRFVAGFIGSPAMNFFEGRIAVNGEGHTAVNGAGHMAVNGAASFVTKDGTVLPLAGAPPDSDGRAAVYGLRPEHLSIDPERGIPAQVAVVEPTGSETMVVARLAGQEVVGVFRDRVTVRPGETLPLRPDPSAAHLFDAEGGGRRLTILS